MASSSKNEQKVAGAWEASGMGPSRETLLIPVSAPRCAARMGTWEPVNPAAPEAPMTLRPPLGRGQPFITVEAGVGVLLSLRVSE